jgi:EmrB/QacA subfamily drug resistance transporter
VSQKRSGGPRVVLISMIVANAMILVDQTAVPLALPSVMKQFGVGTDVAQWVLNASLLALSGLLILGGKLGDVLGRRRIFLLGTTLFITGSAVGGLAPTFVVLLAARVVQGTGGAMMLPGSVAIVNGTFEASERGRALGTMGGAAAVAGALGPTIGGALAAISWRLVLLVNVPLAVVCIVATLASVPASRQRARGSRIDILGAVLLCVAIVGLVYGLTETQDEGFFSPEVLGALVLAVIASALFLWWELHADQPLMNITLLRRTPNYLGSTLSQALAGMAEMGLGLLFPLLLILNLGMNPALAGLALIPITLPMVLLSRVAGNWYDKAGGRLPLVAGFGILAASGLALWIGVAQHNYVGLLPGLLLYGTGLALVLTVNDPVSLDSVGEEETGEVSGVSATAEQAGGAIGIAALSAIFHTVYVQRLHQLIDTGPLKDLTTRQYEQLRDALQAAEQTGLSPHHFSQSFIPYLEPAYRASDRGYAAAFVAVTIIALAGMVLTAILVRRPITTANRADEAARSELTGCPGSRDLDGSPGRQAQPGAAAAPSPST